MAKSTIIPAAASADPDPFRVGALVRHQYGHLLLVTASSYEGDDRKFTGVVLNSSLDFLVGHAAGRWTKSGARPFRGSVTLTED